MMHLRFTRGLTLPTLAAIAVVAVAVGGMFVALLNGFGAFRDDTRDHSRAGLILSHSHAAQQAVVDVETGLRGYLLVDARFLEPFYAGRQAYGARFVALERLVTDRDQRVRMRGLRAAIDAYVEDYALRVRAQGAGRPRAELLAAMGEGKRLVDAIRSRFRAFDSAERQLLAIRSARADARGARVVALAAVGAGGVVLLLLLLAGYLERFVLRPVRRVAIAARRLAAGRRDVRVSERGRGEIALLKSSFNSMAGALGAREEELRVAGDRLQGALSDAVEASRSKSEFLANMSHEIRTPLNGVIGMTELLLQTELSAEQREYAQTASSSGEALLGVINDILDFTKIEAGKLELDVHDFDLREAVEDTCEMLASEAHGKGLELTAFVAEDVPAGVRGDRGRLRQILTNLVSNAIKFTHAGEVAVSVTALSRGEHDTVLRFEVADTGIGIELARLPVLFESFSQADTSTTRRFGGSGLGLPISRQLAALMGGAIGAESDPGRGSRFHLTLRLPDGDADASRSDVPAIDHPAVIDQPAPASAVRVLVAEDNAVNQLVIETMLVKRGLAVDIASDGSEALAMLAAGSYAAVFMDCQMPELDGYEATARIRAGERNGDRLPVIAMTAHAMKGDREYCLAAGMDDYLSKPLRADELDAALAHWFGRPAVAPAAPAAAADDLVDDSRMRTFRDEYPDIAGQLVDLFAASAPPLIGELRAALGAGDREGVRRAAHKLKGSCLNIGATRMAALCRALEAGEDDPQAVADGLEQALAPTEAAIRRALT